MIEIDGGDLLFGSLLVFEGLLGFEDGVEGLFVVVCLEQGVEEGFVDDKGLRL